MAAGGPIEAFCAKLTCPVCLELFKDPVTIPECGRSFCRACLTRSWAESGTSEPSCPQCRRRAQPKSLRPNQQLADFVEIAKRFRPLEGKEGEGREAICERHQEPLELYCRADKTLVCLVCERCKEHRHHEVILLEEACPEIKCQTVIKAEERRVCEKHQEPLKLFCKDDDVPICVACIRSEEHSYHTVIPFAEAAQEYKDQICSWLESLKKEEGNFVTYKAQAIRESLDLLENEILCPLLEQMQKINETLLKVESVFISRQKLILETSRKMVEIEQKALILSSQGVKEEEKEDLGFTLANVLAPLTGSEAKELKEEVDMAPKAYSAFIKEITLPVEGEVEHSKQDTGDLILCEVVMAPWKFEGQKYKEKEKRKKKDYILEMQRLLKRHADVREDAVLKIAISSEEDSSPGEGGEGTEGIKVKKDLIHNWKRFKKKTP